ncbi:hypothetical protein D3C79_1057530 [compost metagenome]
MDSMHLSLKSQFLGALDHLPSLLHEWRPNHEVLQPGDLVATVLCCLHHRQGLFVGRGRGGENGIDRGYLPGVDGGLAAEP